MTDRIKILLADSHRMFRQDTAELLRREPDLEVVGEASDGRQAVELAHTLQPDIVVMDARMPALSGVEAARRICESSPEARVLLFAAYNDDHYVFWLLQAGASGYLLKTAPVSDLVKAIRRVSAGESPLDPALACKVSARQSDERRFALPGEEVLGPEDLADCELEILLWLARGLNNQAIAETLHFSVQTAQEHLTRIFAKLHVTSRLEAVLTAIRRGWLVLES